MSKVGIIFAMNEELEALKKYLKVEKEYKIFELQFYEGTINDVNCILVECGVGKVNAARTTQILIDNFKVDYIFNIGVAGGLVDTIKIGDVIIGDKLAQHDFDITAMNYEKGYIPNLGQKFIDSDEYLIKIAKECMEENDISFKIGPIASGDIFCTDPKMAEKIHSKFDALCVEMEGASVAQVCYLNHIPFLILRSISDTPNNKNQVTFNEFLESSSEVIAESMNLLLNKIK